MSQTYEEPGTALSVAQEPRGVAERPIAAPQLLDALRPAERVALMAEIATVVADVIEKQKWFKQIGPKKHILIQGWTFIGGLGGCSAKTVTTEKIEGGFKAHAVVVRVDSGIEVGSADQVCMSSETNWRGKDDYALMGMASTRACSRALSTVFRHVVELAGYSATPAEEMIAESPRDTAAHPLQGRANGEPRGTAGGRGEVKTPPPARIPVAELQDQARSLGIADFRAWLVANVATDLATRGLRPAESVQAKALLDVMPHDALAVRGTKVVEGEVVVAVPRPAKRAEPVEPTAASREAGHDDPADARKRRALRTRILVNAKIIWPGKETDDERKRAMKLHRCGESLDDAHLDSIALESLESLDRDLARRAEAQALDADDALAEYAEGRLL